jgi:hypothetical protein
MSYNDVAAMAHDEALAWRITAAIAKEEILDPEGWLYARHWRIVSAPGWDAAWASAVAGGVPNPGADEGVITDGMILSAVQIVIQSELPPIIVIPNSTQSVPSTDPKATAEPLTPWAAEQYATFTDGEFRWDGDSWVAYVSAPPPGPDVDLPATTKSRGTKK